MPRMKAPQHFGPYSFEEEISLRAYAIDGQIENARRDIAKARESIQHLEAEIVMLSDLRDRYDAILT